MREGASRNIRQPKQGQNNEQGKSYYGGAIKRSLPKTAERHACACTYTKPRSPEANHWTKRRSEEHAWFTRLRWKRAPTSCFLAVYLAVRWATCRPDTYRRYTICTNCLSCALRHRRVLRQGRGGPTTCEEQKRVL